MRYILFSVLALFFFSSCVTQKKFNEVKKQLEQCENSKRATDKQLRELGIRLAAAPK